MPSFNEIIWIIILAVGLYYLWEWIAPRHQSENEPVRAESHKSFYSIVSYALWGLSIVALISLRDASSGGVIWLLLVSAVAFALLARKFGKKADEVFEEEKRETGLAVDIVRNTNTFDSELVRKRQIEQEAKLELELMDLRRTSEVKSEFLKQRALDTTQKELELQNHLINVGIQQGITATQVTEINTAKYLSEIRVDEKKAFNQADLDNEVAKMREQVRLAIIAKHFSNHQMIGLISEQLDSLYLRIEEIERDKSIPERAKQRMTEDREAYITTLKEDKRGREKRLLEAHNGGDVRGDNEDTDI